MSYFCGSFSKGNTILPESQCYWSPSYEINTSEQHSKEPPNPYGFGGSGIHQLDDIFYRLAVTSSAFAIFFCALLSFTLSLKRWSWAIPSRVGIFCSAQTQACPSCVAFSL